MSQLKSAPTCNCTFAVEGRTAIENLVTSINHYKSMADARSYRNISLEMYRTSFPEYKTAIKVGSDFFTKWAPFGQKLEDFAEFGVLTGKEIFDNLKSRNLEGVTVSSFLQEFSKDKGTRPPSVRYRLTEEEIGLPMLEQQKLVFWRAARAELRRLLSLTTS